MDGYNLAFMRMMRRLVSEWCVEESQVESRQEEGNLLLSWLRGQPSFFMTEPSNLVQVLVLFFAFWQWQGGVEPAFTFEQP